MSDYGRKGCTCFLAEASQTTSHELDHVSLDETKRWYPNARCPHHGILADYTAGRRDTGVYAVVPVGYRPRDLSTPPDGPECPPGVHSMFDPCPGGCLNEDEPEPDPREGCGYHQDGLDCPNDHGPAPTGCSCSVNEPNDLCAYCSQVPRFQPCDEGEDIRTGDAYTRAPVGCQPSDCCDDPDAHLHHWTYRATTTQKERGVLATVRRWIGRALWAHQR